ncbi:MAG: hypothetical protein SNJ76_11755, partial [Fimbriimonadaceae bacterium]
REEGGGAGGGGGIAGIRAARNLANAGEKLSLVEPVVTSCGPTEGHVVLRDGTVPKRVAIVPCVRSRRHPTNRLGSRVCCSDSLKLAHLVKEHAGGEIYRFSIDMRTPGKGYGEFYGRLFEEGDPFIRGRVAEATDIPRSRPRRGI